MFPRLFGFVRDPYLPGLQQSRALHPFHHGIKESDDLLKHYGPFGNMSGNGTCVSLAKEFGSSEIVSLLKNAEKYFFSSPSGDPSCIPRWQHLNSSCIDDLWCPPITWNASTHARADGAIAVNGTLRKYLYSDRGLGWQSTLSKYKLNQTCCRSCSSLHLLEGGGQCNRRSFHVMIVAIFRLNLYYSKALFPGNGVDNRLDISLDN
jgi:hypothetical protein